MKPLAMKKAICFIKEAFQYVVKWLQMYLDSIDMYFMAPKVLVFDKAAHMSHLRIGSILTYLC